MRMNQKTSVLFLTAAALLLLFFTACKKGDQGPQGPQGNANVKTDTFTLVSADWLWNSQYTFTTSNNGGALSYFTRYHDVPFSSLTQGILDSGSVMVYFTPNATNTNQWAPLPYTLPDFTSQYYYVFAFETMPGKLRLHYFYVPNGSSGNTPSISVRSTETIPTRRYKIVAIGGTISTAMKRNKVDMKNYADVSRFLNLAE